MTAVSFSPLDAGRIADAVKWVERHGANTATGEPVPWNDATGLDLGKVQTDFSASGTTVSVKACDAAGTESGDAFSVYLNPDQSAFDPTAVTVANTAATATCKLAAGAIIGYAYSGSDAYMLGAIAQVLKDWWVDTTNGRIVYAVYWRVGIARTTVSNVNGPATRESEVTPCNQPGS